MPLDGVQGVLYNAVIMLIPPVMTSRGARRNYAYWSVKLTRNASRVSSGTETQIYSYNQLRRQINLYLAPSLASDALIRYIGSLVPVLTIFTRTKINTSKSHTDRLQLSFYL